MNIETFSAALLHDAPPSGWSRALQALWHQGKGDWDRAHQLAQAQDDVEGAWVHAHLHRAEGTRTPGTGTAACACNAWPSSSPAVTNRSFTELLWWFSLQAALMLALACV